MADRQVVESRQDPSLGELVTQLSEQTSRLVKDELRLAQVELTAKAKHAGVGVGMFGGAGLFAFLGLGTLVATAVLALALVLPEWAAALVVAVVLLIVAAVVAVLGKKQVSQATPLAPEQTVENVKLDIQSVKEHHSNDDS